MYCFSCMLFSVVKTALVKAIAGLHLRDKLYFLLPLLPSLVPGAGAGRSRSVRSLAMPNGVCANQPLWRALRNHLTDFSLGVRTRGGESRVGGLSSRSPSTSNILHLPAWLEPGSAGPGQRCPQAGVKREQGARHWGIIFALGRCQPLIQVNSITAWHLQCYR